MSIATNVSRIKGNITAALAAIADKGVSVPDGSTSDALAGLIASIEAGGGTIPAASPKDVNFFDYDGTLLHSYTLEEAQALTALPDGPAHDGLVFDGWNYSLESVKSLTRAMNIGAMYATDDGTTRIYIHLEDGRTSPMLGICPNGTVTVDWGDGTDPDTLTGTSLTTAKWTPTHNYADPGDYVIRLTVDGTAQMYGSNASNAYSYLLRYGSSADEKNHVYQNAIRKVEIGNGISIGDYAFSFCYSLANITIPNSVTSIGSNAFYNCYSLASITIPNGVKSIGSSAFYNCYSLTSITIPNSVTSIGSNAFYNCYSLASITIPNGVTSIGGSAFYNCYSLTSITIPDSVTSIENSAFFNCYSLANITIPNSVTSIGSDAFYNCYSLASITIPNGVKSIGGSAFYNCYSLTSITIPNSVTSIGSNAFYNCYSLASITIPNGVKSIGGSAFCNCYGIAYYDFTALSAVPALSSTNAFKGIVADCEIRVPSALVDEWKAATNWATYADYIVGV